MPIERQTSQDEQVYDDTAGDVTRQPNRQYQSHGGYQNSGHPQGGYDNTPVYNNTGDVGMTNIRHNLPRPTSTEEEEEIYENPDGGPTTSGNTPQRPYQSDAQLTYESSFPPPPPPARKNY